MNNTNPLAAQKRADNLRSCVVDLGIIGLYSDAYLALANRLITGKERADRVLTEDQWDTRAQYMAALPQLCADVKQLGSVAVRQCQEMLKLPEHDGFELGKTYQSIYRLLKRFNYQDHVCDGIIPSVPEIRRQLDLCFQLGRLVVDEIHSKQRRN
jgi:RNA polymerase primary sigma factor